MVHSTKKAHKADANSVLWAFLWNRVSVVLIWMIYNVIIRYLFFLSSIVVNKFSRI
jgi:hypothetical protein